MRPLHLPSICPVSGVSFRQAELREILEGDRLTIVANPDNPHDENACEVISPTGTLLGFVPASLAARLTARGEARWSAVVREVLRGETWGLRIEILAPTASGSDGAPTEDTPAVEVADAVRRTVRARSGRPLGALVRVDGAFVVVDQGSSEMQYPADLVTIDAA